jgi:hypothetical protein
MHLKQTFQEIVQRHNAPQSANPAKTHALSVNVNLIKNVNVNLVRIPVNSVYAKQTNVRNANHNASVMMAVMMDAVAEMIMVLNS